MGDTALAPSLPEFAVLGTTVPRASSARLASLHRSYPRGLRVHDGSLEVLDAPALGRTAATTLSEDGTGVVHRLCSVFLPRSTCCPTWRPGIPGRRAWTPPFRAFPPYQMGSGLPVPALLGLPAPRFRRGLQGPFRALFPGRSSLSILKGSLGALLGFLPLGLSLHTALVIGSTRPPPPTRFLR